MNDFSTLETKLGYFFQNKELLYQALTHSSYAHEHNISSYERLEFLGDALLDYVTAEILFSRFPDKNEGELTAIRACLVKEETLSAIADNLSLTSYAFFSQTKQSNPIAASKAVKCDLFESILGSIFIDSGKNIDLITKIITQFLDPYFSEDHIDYKSKLLEIFAKNKINYYFAYNDKFDPKNPVFSVKLIVNDKMVASGEGHNKRNAEKDACRKYYDKIFEK